MQPLPEILYNFFLENILPVVRNLNPKRIIELSHARETFKEMKHKFRIKNRFLNELLITNNAEFLKTFVIELKNHPTPI